MQPDFIIQEDAASNRKRKPSLKTSGGTNGNRIRFASPRFFLIDRLRGKAAPVMTSELPNHGSSPQFSLNRSNARTLSKKRSHSPFRFEKPSEHLHSNQPPRDRIQIPVFISVENRRKISIKTFAKLLIHSKGGTPQTNTLPKASYFNTRIRTNQPPRFLSSRIQKREKFLYSSRKSLYNKNI